MYEGFFSFHQEAALKRIYWPTCFLALLAVVLGPAAVRADSVISPFVDSQTNAVIYLDFSSIDMDMVDAWQQKAIAAIPDPADRAKQEQEAQKGIARAKKWISDFKTAGGKDLYVVVSLAGMMQGAPGGLVIPLNGADPVVLAKVFPQNNAPPPDPNDPAAAQMTRMQPKTAVVGGAMVYSTGAGVEKLQTPSTEPRPDLGDALTVGGASPVRIVLTPGTLKNNPFFAMMMNAGRRGGGPNQPGAPQVPFSEPQWDSVTWMSFSLNLPPKESASCTIQCKDADSAGALADLINQKMQDGKTDPTKRGNISADDYNKLILALKPAVTGAQVGVAVDQDTIDNVIGPIVIRSMQSRAVVNSPSQPAPPPADNNGM
jgi:hypothetical protein